RVLPELFGRDEEDLFEVLRVPERVAVLDDALGGDVGPILDAAELAVTLRRTRAGHLQTLRAGLTDVDLLYLPEIFARSTGLRFTRQVAAALDEELG
ncbi:MAG TPA: anion-transporting ATPase, partial [Iamia sp.]|nr:anion-transporting ATPase [Iamia sp.]